MKMISRKELESMGIVMTDAEWRELSETIMERMWEEDHPLDD